MLPLHHNKLNRIENNLIRFGIIVKYTIFATEKECFESIYFGVNIEQTEKEKLFNMFRRSYIHKSSYTKWK